MSRDPAGLRSGNERTEPMCESHSAGLAGGIEGSQQTPPPQLVTVQSLQAPGNDDQLSIIVGASESQVVRMAAIDTPVRWMGDVTQSQPETGVSPWRTVFGEQGPFAIIRRKAGRFRLPRLFKTELIDRFVSNGVNRNSSLTTLIVVAHPDDESLGAGGRLRHLGDVHLVDVTDGAPRDPACAIRHGFETREQYAEARRVELEKAMEVAGLPPDRLIALGFVDGEATLRLAELCMKVTDLIDSLRPDVILTHPYEGGHTDHDATAFAVHIACGVLRREGVRPPAVLELTSYHALNGQKVVQQFLPHKGADQDQRVVLLSEEDRDVKQRILDCFGTQQSVLERFSTEFERFRPAPRYVFTRPPHEGTLNYERYGNPNRGRTWRDYAEQALRILRMRV
jgi:LmbE family N-acetylglucosaminyl deacetylase